MTLQPPFIQVSLARAFAPEQEYVLDFLLRERLGLAFETTAGAESDTVLIELDRRSVRLPQSLLRGDDRAALTAGYAAPSVRELDVTAAALPAASFGGPTVPVLYGDVGPGGDWVTQTGEDVTLHADVLGASLFLLSRLEEIGSEARDEFDLFPARATLASAHGFLTRPIVDEYVEILRSILERQWPGLCRRPPEFAVRVSHDVDRPRAYDHAAFRDRLWSVRQDARSRVLPPLHRSRGLNAVAAALRLPHNDPFDNFDWLMDTDGREGHAATYYFLCGGATRFDGRYDVRSPGIRALLRRLVERGHEIGVHGSYATIDDAAMLTAERARLVDTLEAEGLPADVSAVRQHYLRWRAPVTWRAAEEAGASIDSSVGFNEAIGFRSGTSFEHPVFDAERRQRLRLRERPLQLMDRALSCHDRDGALAAIDGLRREVARHGGTLEVLWHNNTFTESPLEAERYERAIAGSP